MVLNIMNKFQILITSSSSLLMSINKYLYHFGDKIIITIVAIIIMMMMVISTKIVITTTTTTITQNDISTYNVLVLMVDKSRTNRFDLVHIGPAIDIAMKVCSLVIIIHICLFFWFCYYQINHNFCLSIE